MKNILISTAAIALFADIAFSRDSKWALFRVGYSQKQIENVTELNKPEKQIEL